MRISVLKYEIRLKSGIWYYAFMDTLDFLQQAGREVFGRKYLSTEYKEYIKSAKWKRARKTKLKEQRHCEHCNSTAGLQVHHKSYKNFKNELNNLEDLKVLCGPCHRDVERWKTFWKKMRTVAMVFWEFAVIIGTIVAFIGIALWRLCKMIWVWLQSEWKYRGYTWSKMKQRIYQMTVETNISYKKKPRSYIQYKKKDAGNSYAQGYRNSN